MDNFPTLYTAIKKHLDRNTIRFHMPGHKGRNVLGLRDTFDIDLTEIHGLDNLHLPHDCIAHSETLMAKLCGAHRSFFLVNGSSSGIIASVLALSGAGGSIVCDRNIHISLFRGLCLSGARPFYILPEMLECGICGGIRPENVESALISAGDAKAVFIVSPTYEGFTSDIRSIAEVTHKYGALLFVDEAHGAHFKFSKMFPETALEQGADLAVQSWHKTLAAFGQGAVLHTGGAVDIDKLRFYLSAMQTTSPSYAIMASLDACRELLQTHGTEVFAKYVRNLKYLREQLSHIINIKLISEDIKGKGAITDYDKGKIILVVNGDGIRLEGLLAEKRIFIEMAARNHAVLMTSFADHSEDYISLIRAISELDAGFAPGLNSNVSNADILLRMPEMAYTPGESAKMPSIFINAREAAGRVSAEFITPYPPGIPLVLPGEIISEEAADFCARGNLDGSITLIDGEKLRVLE